MEVIQQDISKILVFLLKDKKWHRNQVSRGQPMAIGRPNYIVVEKNPQS